MKACWVKLTGIFLLGPIIGLGWISTISSAIANDTAVQQASQPGIHHHIKGLSSLAPGMVNLEVWVEGPLEEPLDVKVSDGAGVTYTHLLSPSRRSATSLVVPGWTALTVEVYRQSGELWYQAKQSPLLKANPLKSFIPTTQTGAPQRYFNQLEQRLGLGWLVLIGVGAIVVWASRRMTVVKYLVSGVGALILVAVAWQADEQGVVSTRYVDDKAAFEVIHFSELRRESLQLALNRSVVVLRATPYRVGQVIYDQQHQQLSVLGHKKATLWLLAKADKVALIQDSSLGMAHARQPDITPAP